MPGHFNLALIQGVVLGLLSSTKSVVETEHLTWGVHMLKLMQYLEAVATEGLKAELCLELRYCKSLK